MHFRTYLHKCECCNFQMVFELTFQLLFGLPIHEFAEHVRACMCARADIHIFARKLKYLQIDILAGLVTVIFCVEITCEQSVQ